MVFKYLLLLPLALGASIPRSLDAPASPVSYDGYSTFRVNTNGDVDDVLDKLSALTGHEFWETSQGHIDISIPGFEIDHFKEMAFDFIEMHFDLGKDIDLEKIWEKYIGTHQDGKLPDDCWFDTYHPYDDHIAFWEDLHAAFPDNSEYFVAGESYEGRDIFGYKFFGDEHEPSTYDNSSGKEAVIWHGTVHAREWISTMTVEYLAYNMIENYGRDSFWTDVLNSYDFYILPVVNPDGFVYTQEVDRLWRKNRAPPPPDADNQTCFGVDINRNWPFQWGGEEGGASSDPCSQTYGGESGGDTPENTAIRAQMADITAKQDLKLYIDFHSYSQLLISPFGYTCEELPETNEEMVALANATAAAIEEVYGTEYVTGPGCQTLYQVSGGSRDYGYAVAGAQFSYTMELRDQGDFGFVLPPEQIRPNCEEVLAGMEVMLTEM